MDAQSLPSDPTRAPLSPWRGLLKTALHWSDVVYFLGLSAAVFAFGVHNWIWGAGLVFAAVFFVLWIVARLQLGTSFTVAAEARKLVSSGFYRWLSHPIYYFGALSHLGLVVAFQHWWLLPIWFGIPGPFQLARMKREDAVLDAEFGEAFRRLRRGTIF